MAKLTLHRLLQRLQLTALQLAIDSPTPYKQLQLQKLQQQQPLQQQQQHLLESNNNNSSSNRTRMAFWGWLQMCQGNGHYLTLAVLIYGYLMLHASAAAGVATTASTPAISNLTTPLALSQSQQLQQQQQNAQIEKRDVAHVPEDEYDASYPDDIDDIEALINNKSAKGKYIGAPCNELKCDAKLLHVTCEKESQTCSCERNYPVQLGPVKGCAKPLKKLGDQCFYDETCLYNDENSLCVQVRHNAICQCASGYHSVSYTKPTRRIFCTPDLSELSSDLPTLLGVSTGIAVLAGLICMVLHLFSKTKYPRHRNFGDANIPPPILYSSDTGIPLTVHSARPSSRSSIRSTGSIGSFGNRRASSGGLPGNAGAGGGHHSGGGAGGGNAGGCGGGGGGGGGGGSKGILVSTSRTGAARSAAILLISCHITAVSKQNSRASSRQTSGAGCSQHSRDTLDDNNGSGGVGGGGGSGSGCRSCESTLSMNRQLQKQLNHQRHLLSFELSPAKSKNQDRFRTLLGMNGIDHEHDNDDDDYDEHNVDDNDGCNINSIGGVGVGGFGGGISGGGGGGDGSGSGGLGLGGGPYNCDADLHHLHIGALPTPASETPRFAVLEDQV
ncbi:uncharacterized protein LOC133841045 [Drosophila sulfurigaster albostrigata]|uniref:uncharacterized protein LOC133841045 n=1 Tax=Drosophila sulfurigaster albostrigata TaxID=89887 RepID=UPI002D21E576|nr:uncharacterized protein LOC133841045 [Drosophila sulfurigaster albostrigata]